MKKLLFVSALLISTLSQAASIANFKNLLPAGTYEGTMSKDTTCRLRATWISETELQIETSVQYKDYAANEDTSIFTDAKKANFITMRLSEATKLAEVSQSEIIHKDGDYEVHRYQVISLDLDDSNQIKSINVNISHVDHESDPSEVVFMICDNIKKTK